MENKKVINSQDDYVNYKNKIFNEMDKLNEQSKSIVSDVKEKHLDEESIEYLLKLFEPKFVALFCQMYSVVLLRYNDYNRSDWFADKFKELSKRL